MSTPPKNFVPEPFDYHHELEVRVDSLTNLGIGLGRVDNWVVMVPFTLPGELVKARIYRNHKNYSDADLIEVLEASPERVEPKCPLFGDCGGCQYQHLAYDGQLRWKREQVVDLLERIGGLSDILVNKPIGSPQEYYYRSKLTPHYPKPRVDDERFPIGFLKIGQRTRLVDVPHCPIATEAINKALPGAREEIWAFKATKKKKRGGTLLLRHTMEGITTDANAVVSERVGKFVFQFSAGEFFQNNPFILPKLVDYVLEQAQEEGIDNLIDAYCGVGLFAISASKSFKKCIGVEVSASAIQWANGNAAINNTSNCEFRIGQSESIFKEITFLGSQTAMVIDPPRKGCDMQFLNQLAIFGPKRLVYVACDPATQARDVSILVGKGYRVTAVQPFDLFPQTRHIENVVTLELVTAS